MNDAQKAQLKSELDLELRKFMGTLNRYVMRETRIYLEIFKLCDHFAFFTMQGGRLPGK